MKAYWMVIICFCLLGGNVFADVVYVDPADGTGRSWGGLDLNGDGTIDYETGKTVYAPFSNPSSASALTNKVHTFGVFPDSNWDVPQLLAAGDKISDAAGFSWWGDAYILGYTGNPSLVRNQDQYMGLRFNASATTNDPVRICFGWIRISVDSNDTITFKDYAYEDQPGVSILAGQTTTSAISDFEAWATTKNLTTGSDGPTDDPDQDRIPNLLEFALGLEPMAIDTSGLPTAQLVGNTIEYTFSSKEPSITYQVETSTSLSDPNGWQASGSPVIGASGLTSTHTISRSEIDATGTLFIRLQVSE